MINQSIIITGGTGGLGSAVTEAFLELGANITLPFTNSRGWEQLRDRLGTQQFSKLNTVQADVSDSERVAKIVSAMERVDALVHLVGGFAMGDTADFSDEDWHHQININLTTTFTMVRAVLPKMQTQNYGRIITISSRAAEQPAGKMAAYSATKAAVLAFTRAVADEFRDTDITANTVLPGTIDTAANRSAMGDEAARLWVKPEAIAKVITFLASPEAGDISGAAIPVYGNS
jgi:NAD(P)-dependent dehydrogenase (short-subunit alcohol dehydrogenase family)